MARNGSRCRGVRAATCCRRRQDYPGNRAGADSDARFEERHRAIPQRLTNDVERVNAVRRQDENVGRQEGIHRPRVNERHGNDGASRLNALNNPHDATDSARG